MTQLTTTVLNFDPAAIDGAIALWAQQTTGDSPRQLDLLRDKATAVGEFFAQAKLHPAAVRPIDIRRWSERLKETQKPATVYAKISRVSSFYKYLIKQGITQTNPAQAARPKAPAPYSGDKTKSLTDKEMNALLRRIDGVAQRKGKHQVVAARDYAMLLMMFRSGVRVNEIMVKWRDLTMNDTGVVFSSRRKGGDIITQEIKSVLVRDAIRRYVELSGRVMKPESALWTDSRPGSRGKMLTARTFARNLKRWGRQCGVSIHPHQTRHTFARIVAEDSGSWTETQDALGHRNAATTRVYVQRVGVKKDRVGDSIERRMK